VRSAGLTALVVLLLDLLTKHLALQRLPPGRPVHVIDGFFSLTLVMNPGLAFGMLAGTPDHQHADQLVLVLFQVERPPSALKPVRNSACLAPYRYQASERILRSREKQTAGWSASLYP